MKDKTLNLLIKKIEDTEKEIVLHVRSGIFITAERPEWWRRRLLEHEKNYQHYMKYGWYTSEDGKFGIIRKHDVHTGVDVYCEPGTAVTAIESGIVVAVVDFTGEKAGSPWWNDTKAVMVEGDSGVILYGEINTKRKVGEKIKRGQIVGGVKTVLKKNKGKPMSMLHLELYRHGTKEPTELVKRMDQLPDNLLDPTFLLERLSVI